jgi:hypothetical protein
MEQVLKTFGVVEACLETWDFQSCAWVRGDKADPDIESLSKKAEVVFMQFETWRDVLATVSKNLAHATQEQNESVAAVMACTSAVQGDIGKAKINFCTVLLTSALLKAESAPSVGKVEIDMTLKYVSQKLRVPTQTLPPRLKERLAGPVPIPLAAAGEPVIDVDVVATCAKIKKLSKA